MSIETLKEEIFKITKNMNLGESYSQELAYKIFVEHAYKAILQAWVQVNKGFGTSFYVDDSWKTTPVKDLDLDLVEKAVITYMNMVKESEPFTDILSMVHEEILLTGRRGERLGQFLTPPDLANLLSELVMTDEDIRSMDKVKTLSEPCCGSGSMILAPLARMAKVDRSKVRYVQVMLNDIDTLMCKVATLQVVASSMMHAIKFNSLMVYNCNLLTGWSKENTLMVGLMPMIDEDSAEMIELFILFNQYLSEQSKRREVKEMELEQA
ncbi:TPA: N-6 DNA methylase [Pseudomonas aeruginosa]